MKTVLRIISMVIPSIIVFSACEPMEKYSDVPEIHFKSFDPYLLLWTTDIDTTYIEAGDLVFSFIDGDSDFGVDQTAEDTINLFIVPYQKTEGIYEPLDPEIYGRKYTVKRDERMDKAGHTVKGEIKVQLLFFVGLPADTVRYDFYIIDRAGNQSNVESSSDISF